MEHAQDVSLDETVREMELGPFDRGLLHILEGYDPEKQVVLRARHHPGETFSAYLISWEPGPRESDENTHRAAGEST